MSLTQIVLPTNKSTSTVSDDTRTLNQDEKGLIQRFVILDANGQAYNLNDKKVQFNEQKTGGKVVIDDTNITYVDRNAGTIDYKLHPQVYAASGDCWLAIINNDGSVVDTTKKFHYNVEKSATITINDDNYVSSMEAQLANLKATVQRVDDTLSQKLTESDGKVNGAVAKYQQALTNATNELNTYQSRYNSLDSQWNQTFNKINSDATNQKNDIQAKADKQAKAIQDRADSTNSSAVAELNKIKQDAATAIQNVNTQRDATIKSAQDQYKQQLSNLQSDYNTWKDSKEADLTAQLKSITDQIASDKSQTIQVHNEVVDIQKQIAEAEKAWDSVDFTKFVTGNQFKEAMAKKASGLKVRGLGGDYIMALDAQSNIDATPQVGSSQTGLVDMGVLSGAIQVMADAILDKNHYTKQEVDQMKQQVLDTVKNKITSVSQSVSANGQRISALENAGYVKYKDSGFSSAAEAQQWAQQNHGIAIFDDGQ